LGKVDLNEFIGTWESESGNILEICPNDRDSLKVNFISGHTGKPVIREYCENKESVDMLASLDFYKSSLEVELWKKGKGFHLTLLYDWIDLRLGSGYYLAPGLSEYINSDLVNKYRHLFEPLDYYKRIKTSP
jgi:hypothetical protein